MSVSQFFNDYAGTQSTLVPVIASFDSEGHVKPLYVRVGELSLKVQSFWLKPSLPNVLEFHCKVIDNGCLKPLILFFHQRETVWIMENQPLQL